MDSLTLSLTPGLDQPPVTRQGREQIIKWAQEELDFCNALYGAMQAARPWPFGGSSAWLNARGELEWIINEGSKNPAIPQGEYQSRAERALDRMVLLSGDPRSTYLRSLSAEGASPHVIASLYCLWVDEKRAIKESVSTPQLAGPLAVATVHRELYHRNVDAKQAKRAGEAIKRAARESSDAIARASDLVLKVEERRIEWEREAAGVLATRDKELGDAVEETKESAKNFLEVYNTELSLRAPATYWSDKAVTHKASAKRALVAFLVMLVAGAIGVGLLAEPYLFEPLKNAAAGGASGSTVLYPLAVFSVMVAMLAWPLRLASKMFLSHGHLAEDATERELIVKTYLSLMEKSALDPEDRRLFLAAIFRQTPVGLVKDDGGLSPLDLLISKQIGR